MNYSQDEKIVRRNSSAYLTRLRGRPRLPAREDAAERWDGIDGVPTLGSVFSSRKTNIFVFESCECDCFRVLAGRMVGASARFLGTLLERKERETTAWC